MLSNCLIIAHWILHSIRQVCRLHQAGEVEKHVRVRVSKMVSSTSTVLHQGISTVDLSTHTTPNRQCRRLRHPEYALFVVFRHIPQRFHSLLSTTNRDEHSLSSDLPPISICLFHPILQRSRQIDSSSVRPIHYHLPTVTFSSRLTMTPSSVLGVSIGLTSIHKRTSSANIA